VGYKSSKARLQDFRWQPNMSDAQPHIRVAVNALRTQVRCAKVKWMA